MAILEIPDKVYEALAERARINERSVVDEAVAELSDDPEELRRREYLKVLEHIRALPPIKSNLDPVALIREDRDKR